MLAVPPLGGGCTDEVGLALESRGRGPVLVPLGAAALQGLPSCASPFQDDVPSSPVCSALSFSFPIGNHFYYFIILVYSFIVSI